MLAFLVEVVGRADVRCILLVCKRWKDGAEAKEYKSISEIAEVDAIFPFMLPYMLHHNLKFVRYACIVHASACMHTLCVLY